VKHKLGAILTNIHIPRNDVCIFEKNIIVAIRDILNSDIEKIFLKVILKINIVSMW